MHKQKSLNNYCIEMLKKKLVTSVKGFDNKITIENDSIFLEFLRVKNFVNDTEIYGYRTFIDDFLLLTD